MMNNRDSILHIVDLYNHHYQDGRAGSLKAGISYRVLNKMFYFEIDGVKHSLSKNRLADKPDGVGDELADQIAAWAHPVN